MSVPPTQVDGTTTASSIRVGNDRLDRAIKFRVPIDGEGLSLAPTGRRHTDAIVVDNRLDLGAPVLARLAGEEPAVDRRLALGG